jgi:hypothetical protein
VLHASDRRWYSILARLMIIISPSCSVRRMRTASRCAHTTMSTVERTPQRPGSCSCAVADTACWWPRSVDPCLPSNRPL